MESDFDYSTDDDQILYKTRSPYQEIKLTRLTDGEVALYLDENIQFVSGFDDMVYHGVLASIPARMMHGQPGEVLILGGGDGLAARNLLRFPNVKRIHMVELDPGMIEFSAKHPIMRQLNKDAFRNPKLKVTVQDAKKWLKKGDGHKYSVAIIDFPDPTDPGLEDLFSVELYEDVLRHMTKTPVMSVQSSGALSDTEMLAKEHLCYATRTVPIPVRFRGQWMVDGTILYAGGGVDQGMARIPSKYASHEAKEQGTSSLF